VRPADDECRDETDREEHGGREAQPAADHRRHPVEHLDAGRTAIRKLAAEKNKVSASGRPTANMWCAHTLNERKAIATLEPATKR